MRQVVGALSLGIMLGTASVGLEERRVVPPDAAATATEGARADDGERDRGGRWTARLPAALQRFRLNPGPDHRERAAPSCLRP